MPMLQGIARWAKVVGEPQADYNKTGKEWTIDIELDKASADSYLKSGGSKVYLKKREDGTPYLKFVRKSITATGDPAKPFRIVDKQRHPWDQRTLIGNGSIVNFKYALNEVSMGPNKGAMKPSLIALQVWEHEEYESKDDFPTEGVNGDEEDWKEDE